MLHIVIISPIFAVDEQDTINLPFLQLHCKELLTRGVKLTIISEQYPMGPDYQWNGVQVITIKRKTPKAIYKFLRKYRMRAALKKIHHEHPVQVIHNYWFNILGEISERFALKNNIKHIITLAGQDILPSINTYIHGVTGYSGLLICPSLFHKLKLQENYAVSPQVIGFGIDAVQQIHTERDIDLILCGWINHIKNWEQFLEIVSELQTTSSVKKVVICGGGPMMKELILEIERLKLKDLIELKDSIPRNEVLALMQRSKLLVHTSHFESFGLVLAEGLACNCRVISKPVGIAYNDKDILTCVSTAEFVSTIQQELSRYSVPPETYDDRYSIKRSVDEHMVLYRRLALEL